jgi:DNA-binding NarL/FixJ family response regulator
MRELRARWPEATVVAIGTPLQLAAQAPTADGWVEQPGAGARDVFAIAEAVSEARQGRIRLPIPPGVERQLAIWESLTRRQRQVLGLLGCGLANPKIAAALGVSERAVKVHVSSLLETFSVDNRTGLALIACLAGFPFVQLASDTNQLTLGLR